MKAEELINKSIDDKELYDLIIVNIMLERLSNGLDRFSKIV